MGCVSSTDSTKSKSGRRQRKRRPFKRSTGGSDTAATSPPILHALSNPSITTSTNSSHHSSKQQRKRQQLGLDEAFDTINIDAVAENMQQPRAYFAAANLGAAPSETSSCSTNTASNPLLPRSVKASTVNSNNEADSREEEVVISVPHAAVMDNRRERPANPTTRERSQRSGLVLQINGSGGNTPSPTVCLPQEEQQQQRAPTTSDIHWRDANRVTSTSAGTATSTTASTGTGRTSSNALLSDPFLFGDADEEKGEQPKENNVRSTSSSSSSANHPPNHPATHQPPPSPTLSSLSRSHLQGAADSTLSEYSVISSEQQQSRDHHQQHRHQQHSPHRRAIVPPAQILSTVPEARGAQLTDNRHRGSHLQPRMTSASFHSNNSSGSSPHHHWKTPPLLPVNRPPLAPQFPQALMSAVDESYSIAESSSAENLEVAVIARNLRLMRPQQKQKTRGAQQHHCRHHYEDEGSQSDVSSEGGNAADRSSSPI